MKSPNWRISGIPDATKASIPAAVAAAASPVLGRIRRAASVRRSSSVPSLSITRFTDWIK